ncbi:MAG: ATP-dependent DNA helicase RecG [Candidatus Kapabacteria bacterium]|nr:ATP-dependent DNA helicase RecG [Candidatus Kapabacteria bacterium]
MSADAQAPLILPLQYIKGVGPRRAEMLAKEGLVTYADVIYHVPRGYVDRTAVESIADMLRRYRAPDLWNGDASSAIKVTSQVTLVATLTSVRKMTVGKGRSMISATLQDESGTSMRLIFWSGLSYYERFLKVGSTYVVHGVPQYDPKWADLNMHHPEMEEVDPEEIEMYRSGSILPRYPMTQGLKSAGITMRLMRSIAEYALDKGLADIIDPVPEHLRRQHRLMPQHDALRKLHLPDSIDEVNRAKHRMKYEELFIFEVHLAARRASRKRPERGLPMQPQSPRARAVMDALPYELTRAQKRVIREIIADMSSGAPMNRLLQGDVGSGKTVVAALCMLNAIDNGYQTVLLAPTEILAEQHYHSLSKLLEPLGNIGISQLVGAQRSAARRHALEQIRSGAANIVVGTHALFEANVEYHRLGLIVIDEQHRFGVAQRKELRRMGQQSHGDQMRTPHILVMSATPIPRTLAMTLYGDLDSSVIDEMPANRKPIITRVVFESALGETFGFIRSQVRLGRQAYIVYPLVEKSEKIQAKSAVEHYEWLKDEMFPDLKVGLLHGQMLWNEKEEIMRAFLRREFDVLVSTTVIEVGIDIPNASVMLIENAERFGLSQLHQLRGRVGRGSEQSYCFLATKDHFRYQVSRSQSSEDAMASVVRLRTMEQTTDGFQVAEVDLQLRGPGDVMGTRQSGIPEFRFADLIGDASIIAQARTDAHALLENDPQLRLPEHAALREEVIRQFDTGGLITVA